MLCATFTHGGWSVNSLAKDCRSRTTRVNTQNPGVIQLAPALLLLSDDEELTEFVRGVIKPPWRLARYGDGACASHKVFAQPNVRIVIIDDQVVEENDRGWLLTRIRKRIPSASLLYVAGNHSDASEKRARGNGAHYYVSKPLSFERFGYVLQSFLRAKG
jgi:DNA-binding response OmpR family regulator